MKKIEPKLPRNVIDRFNLAKEALLGLPNGPERLKALMKWEIGRTSPNDSVRPESTPTYSGCCDSYIEPDKDSALSSYNDADDGYDAAVASGASASVIHYYDCIRNYELGRYYSLDGLYYSCCTS